MLAVFALAGLSESGKSTTGRYFESRGIKKLKIVTFLKEVQAKDGDAGDLQQWIWRTESERPDWFASRFADELLQYLQQEDVSHASIESLYGPGLAREMKRRLGSNFIIVYVDIPYDIRLDRQVQRLNLSSREEAQSYLDPRDAVKIDKGVLLVKDMADERIDNSGTVNDLHRQLDEILARHSLPNSAERGVL